MNDWKVKAEILLEQIDGLSDELRARIKRVTGYHKPLMIAPYLSVGTTEKIVLKGRVLEDRAVVVNKDDSRWQNLINIYKRFETNEVPNAHLKARFQDFETETFTDYEGYFNLEINHGQSLNIYSGQNIELELLNPRSRDGGTISA